MTKCKKRPHASRHEALVTLNDIRHSTFRPLKRAYRCPKCNAWHTTRNTKTREKELLESLNTKNMHPREKKYLEEFLFSPEDEITKGTSAMALMYGLDFDDEHAHVGWQKFAGRRVGDVRKCVNRCLNQRQERRWHTVSEFGRSVPAVQRSA